jgi:IS5 family transposase
MKQMTLAAKRGFEKHNRATRKAEFLARMEGLMPWAEFCALIEPHYPKAGNGRPPVGLERMLRMYCVANWFNLADEACEDALYDVPVFREFCRIDLGRERVPDATTLLHFRHLLEKHGRRIAAGQRHEAVGRHHCGCHADRGPTLDQEPGEEP